MRYNFLYERKLTPTIVITPSKLSRKAPSLFNETKVIHFYTVPTARTKILKNHRKKTTKNECSAQILTEFQVSFDSI